MSSKELQGIEAAKRILDWQKGSTAAERLASIVLRIDNYLCNDPSHPLGGPDGGVDIRCRKGDVEYAVAVYFPRGAVSFSEIKKKMSSDLAKSADIRGFVFVVNQEITVGQREELLGLGEGRAMEMYHLEKIASVLNSPVGYGLRLEFLDIEMNREEQVSFVFEHSKQISSLVEKVEELLARNNERVTGEPQRVIPQPLNPYYSSGVFGNRIQFCKKCGYGYMVGGYGYATTALLTIGGYSVTCPNCRNTEYWNRPIF